MFSGVAPKCLSVCVVGAGAQIAIAGREPGSFGLSAPFALVDKVPLGALT
jgi:hypothetical protein